MSSNSENAQTKKDESRRFSISLDRIQDFEFRVKFDGTGLADIVADEPSPLGHDNGPNPGRLLAAAVGGCLSASLLFCAQKLRLDLREFHTEVNVAHTRNENGRLRIGKVEVILDPRFENPDPQKLQRCFDMYEDFCVVTQSVRQGLDVSVQVKPQ